MEQTLASTPRGSRIRVQPHTYLCITDLYEQKLDEGELIAASCLDCETMSFPPAQRCEHCESKRQRPVALSGRARLCSAQVASRPGEMSLGCVLLEEGICISAPLVGAFRHPAVLVDKLRDKPVEVRPTVLRIQGLRILAFQPT